MKLYSDYPARRTAQIIADVVALGVIAISIWVGTIVYAAIAVLASFGRTVEDAGNGIEQTMLDAGETLGGVPFIGDGIRTPFDAASGAGTLLAEAGQAQQDAVMTTAVIVGIVVALVPILLMVWIWLRRRSALGSPRDRGTQPLATRGRPRHPGAASSRERGLSRPPRDRSGTGRRVASGRQTVVRALAQLELRESGVKLR